jgi:hypothetical protein
MTDPDRLDRVNRTVVPVSEQTLVRLSSCIDDQWPGARLGMQEVMEP